MLRLIDTHAHLDEIEDLHVALKDASDVGVVAIVAVGTGYDSNKRVLEISRQYKNLVYPALGLHPWQLAHMESSTSGKCTYLCREGFLIEYGFAGFFL